MVRPFPSLRPAHSRGSTLKVSGLQPADLPPHGAGQTPEDSEDYRAFRGELPTATPSEVSGPRNSRLPYARLTTVFR